MRARVGIGVRVATHGVSHRTAPPAGCFFACICAPTMVVSKLASGSERKLGFRAWVWARV